MLIKSFTCLFTSFLLIVSLQTFAQDNYVQKTYAYYDSSTTTGIITYFIYIETEEGTLPVWDTAIIDRSIYVVHADKIDITPVQVGERKSDGKLITIRPAPGNDIHKLEFDLVEPAKNTGTSEKLKNTFLLKGALNGTKMNYKVRNLVALKSFD